uniref:Ig-like domain-containing protein n=1 Tax=Oryzias sinensis TaxID=183150 RepID=A0A8C7X3W2_9TELE
FLYLTLQTLSCSKNLTQQEHQPPELWRRRGEDAKMDCSHTKGAGYYQMYWFRQLPGESMRLVVLTTAGTDKHDFGDFSTEKFSASKPDAHSGSFSVLKVEPADEGVYFCAVGAHRHSDAENRMSPSVNQTRQGGDTFVIGYSFTQT